MSFDSHSFLGAQDRPNSGYAPCKPSITRAHFEASSRMAIRRSKSNLRQEATLSLARVDRGTWPNMRTCVSGQWSSNSPPKTAGSLKSGIKMKKWDAPTRMPIEWDSLRRDQELWFPDGNCHVYLYDQGQSQRGASFCIPIEAIQRKRCGLLFEQCQRHSPASAFSEAPLQESRPHSARSTVSQVGYELYLPAPPQCSRQQALIWHITTRNLIAWICNKSLVGVHLGTALVDLRRRLTSVRDVGVDDEEDLTRYMEAMGYLHLSNCPEYALALLHYAEKFRIRELWSDAFAHCVGMNDLLYVTTGFELVSERSKVLITRAYLEMQVHLSHVSKAMSNFLEDDLSDSYFGLAQGARNHLERFRSFIISFYVAKLGYWPPVEGSAYPKCLYRSMYSEFRDLYDFLVDPESTNALESQKLPSGGICVLQNVQAFDRRHKYVPLPHPLPLIPEHSNSLIRSTSHQTLLTFRLRSRQSKAEYRRNVRAGLLKATNVATRSWTGCSLVKAYLRFECEWSVKPEEKVSLQDARKVRWVLIYAVLQMLVSVVRAPKEVRFTNDATYPLCCLIPSKAPWEGWTKAVSMGRNSVGINSMVDQALLTSPNSSDAEDISRSPSIHPDCEYDGQFQLRSRLINDSPKSSIRLSDTRTSQLSGSRRSSILELRRFSLPLLSRKSGISKAVQLSRPPSYCEIFIYGYGNGLNPATVASSEAINVAHKSVPSEFGDIQTLVRHSTILPLPSSTNNTPSADCLPLSFHVDALPDSKLNSSSIIPYDDHTNPSTPDRSSSTTSSTNSGLLEQKSTWSSRRSSNTSATSTGGGHANDAVSDSPVSSSHEGASISTKNGILEMRLPVRKKRMPRYYAAAQVSIR